MTSGMLRALDAGSRLEGGSSLTRAKPRPVYGDHSELLKASEAVPSLVPVKTALASVSDKEGLAELGGTLAKFGIEMIATEGTASELRSLESKGLKLSNLTAYTGFPENLNGRLKTLHQKIQAGVLAIKGVHEPVLEKIEAKFIDLLIVNFYPFKETVARSKEFYECIEYIDIGGPALLRAGAKNHACVTAICDPNDYKELIQELEKNSGHTSLNFRRKCAMKVFELTSNYDRAIADWFKSKLK
jgi:phosphoribosylaminoimidazolecarboxamide formyltransferase/IMP cyclohydrolase